MKYLYGVDVGGTSIKLGLFTIDGENLAKFSILTDKTENGKNVLKDIAKAIVNNYTELNINKSEIKGIGIGVPGPVTNGVVNRCVNIGWGIVDVKTELEALTGISVSVSNDANVAGLGELWQGGGSGYKDLVFITLGTGVGGAVIINGQILDGFVGAGGEIGHSNIPNSETGYACNCGKSGCLETVASATGVVRVAYDLLNSTEKPSSLRSLSNFEAKDVFDEAKNGDELAIEVVEFFGKNLGFICANIAQTINPEAFVFGGGVSKAGQIILDVVQKHFNQYAFYALKDTEFKLATLGNDAGIFGAAYLSKIN